MTLGELKALLTKSSAPDDREIFVETADGFRPITGMGVLKQLGDGGVHARYLATSSPTGAPNQQRAKK
jgi:hypothetical protein